VQLLERLSDKVVLALDADRAGINAMKKAADLMLRRGLDVKVAEMPEGKDPADIINENKDNFKQIIRKSVHVIEFLLHVLKRTETDERSYKRKAKEEVLPFVLLLPSRIDQEHFVKSIAQAIDTSTDAVRFELDRLREKGSSVINYGSEASDSIESKTSLKSAASSLESLYAFLLAASEVVDDTLKAKLEKQLQSISFIDTLEKPSESEFSGLVFTLEEQFKQLPELAVSSEIATRLNVLKTNLLRRKVAEARQVLLEAEADGDDEGFTKHLQTITSLEKEMREPQLEPEHF
jgi:DNA primase